MKLRLAVDDILIGILYFAKDKLPENKFTMSREKINKTFYRLKELYPDIMTKFTFRHREVYPDCHALNMAISNLCDSGVLFFGCSMDRRYQICNSEHFKSNISGVYNTYVKKLIEDAGFTEEYIKTVSDTFVELIMQ